MCQTFLSNIYSYASSNPSKKILIRTHPSDSKENLARLSIDYNLPNLTIDGNGTLESVISRCATTVSTGCTSLLMWQGNSCPNTMSFYQNLTRD